MNPRVEENFHRKLYLALQALRGRPVGRFIKRLQAWEQLSRQDFDELVRTRLQDTLRYARARVPLYSSGLWNEAFSRSDPTNILHWPILERKLVVTHRKQLQVWGRGRGIFYRHSSASTGEPLKVAYSPHAAAWSWANEHRAMLWYGVAPGVKTLMMWGSSHPWTDWVRNCKVFLTTELTPTRLEEATQYLLRQRPTLFVGLPSAAAQLARYVRTHHPDAPQPLVPYLKLGGEQVYPFQREEIARHIGARVVEFYGCTEVGAMAAECPAGAMHVFAEHVHLEILRDGKPVPAGEFGEIVVTSLTNRAMPLVRCRIGDHGRLAREPCSCGRPQPVLTEIVGRAADMFVAADGSRVHGSVLGQGLESVLAAAPLGSIGQVLFHQVDERNWKVLVESPSRIDDALAGRLSEVVRTAFGRECQVEIERVTLIPRETSGKFRYYRARANQAGAPR